MNDRAGLLVGPALSHLRSVRYCIGVAKKRSKPAKRRVQSPEESPDLIRRVALHVAECLECQRLLLRSLELHAQGKHREAKAAEAKARALMRRMTVLEYE